MQKKIIVVCLGTLLALNQAVAMETGGESYEEDATITLMKKTWEQRGKITQMRRLGPDCFDSSTCCPTNIYPQLEELDRKLDKIAILNSEAQHYQHLAQQLVTQGNKALAAIKKEIAELEVLREEKLKQQAQADGQLPKAKL